MKPSPCDLPPGALLHRYKSSGAYTDCYTVEVPRRVSHAEYVEAFYTTFVFKTERVLLSWLVSKPSTDAQAGRLARGELGSFAAWTVEARAAQQLLMADYVGRTKSWLMIAQSGDAATRLYFGSAVVPVRDQCGQPRMGRSYSALLGFHKLYSRVLLRAAAAKITTASRSAASDL